MACNDGVRHGLWCCDADKHILSEFLSDFSSRLLEQRIWARLF